MPPAELSSDVLAWIVAVWLFALGGAIGSFLNVVVYRVPAGMSLVEPGSHCPHCKRPIRWFDNVPILAWILLWGRCRDCRAMISMRYPLVEAGTALLFVVLGWVECFGDGANLPQRLAARTRPELCAIYLYHLTLLCTLLAAVLIESDGHAPLPRLFVPAMIVGVLAPAVWPGVRPVSAAAAWTGWWVGLADGAVGLAAGAASGWVARGLLGIGRASGMVLCAACLGLFLGWQAVLVLSILTAVVHLAATAINTSSPDQRRAPATCWLAMGALGWILTWRSLVACFPVLG